MFDFLLLTIDLPSGVYKYYTLAKPKPQRVKWFDWRIRIAYVYGWLSIFTNKCDALWCDVLKKLCEFDSQWPIVTMITMTTTAMMMIFVMTIECIILCNWYANRTFQCTKHSRVLFCNSSFCCCCCRDPIYLSIYLFV